MNPQWNCAFVRLTCLPSSVWQINGGAARCLATFVPGVKRFVKSDPSLGDFGRPARSPSEAAKNPPLARRAKRLAAFLVCENGEAIMLYKMGRFLQFVGLFIILPAAIVGQARDDLTLGQMFVWTGVGIAVFYLGWNLQQARKG
jgi:hypothetical protein